MKSGGNQWQVDDSLLTETGRGGLFTDGYLQGRPLESYFERGETPLFVFGDGKRGVSKVDGEETDRIVPASGFRAITAVTDRHVLFVVGGGGRDGDWHHSIRLGDVDRVTVEEGLIRDQLSVYVDGVEWQVYLKDVATDRVVSVLEDLSWAWIRVETEIGEARKRLVDASQYRKSRAYEDAESNLAEARRHLGDASAAVESVPEEAADGMAERVAQIESRYRDTKRRLHASRATHLVDEAERHWRGDEFEAAYETFERAREQYQTVLDIYGLAPDKASAMRDRIEHVEANLELLSSAPLDRAEETRSRALAAEDPETALDAWSDALEQFRTVIELDWGADRERFDGDVDLARDRVIQSVDGILAARHALADQCRDRGDERIESGDVGDAREAYSAAISHLESARELAREFDPDALDRIDARLDDLGSCIEDAAANVAASDDTDEYSDFDNWVTLSAESEDSHDEDESEATGPEVDAPEADEPGPNAFEADSPEADPSGSAGEPSASLLADGTDASAGDSPLDSLRDVSDPFDAGDGTEPPASVVDTVRSLSERVLLEVTEATWSALDWTTELRTVADESVVHATRTDPDPATLVVAVADSASEDAVETVRSARTAADADRATLVTVEETSDAAVRRASEADVELLGPTDFARLLATEDLTDLLPDATA
ncbi:hypothetical protein GJ629_13165 [Halapricum sp. CBA1109]|uniref:hypothetical protein n=1 Tax=Halapricum sp. CBA1109 TaxID=2668068 RepID=UPI0012FADE25|nr:hypothetical protein [Halapricum sp. CBA1109]MUV90733.1 hypothetical protein [Halapricum sp. CBA1109]